MDNLIIERIVEFPIFEKPVDKIVPVIAESSNIKRIVD